MQAGRLWLQQADGGPPEQLTHFANDRAFSHAWNPDGKWLYLFREESTSDAVLIRNFCPPTYRGKTTDRGKPTRIHSENIICIHLRDLRADDLTSGSSQPTKRHEENTPTSP